MFLFTVIPYEVIYEEEYTPPKTVEINRGEMRLLVEPMDLAKGRILQVISTDPNWYLDPTLQPGQEIFFSETHWQ